MSAWTTGRQTGWAEAAALKSERDALSLMLRAMARRLFYERRARRNAQGLMFQHQHRSTALLKRMGSAVGVRRAGYGGWGEADGDVEKIIAESLRQRVALLDAQSERDALTREVEQLRAGQATALELLDDVLEDLESAIPYAGEYFDEKWSMSANLTAFRRRRALLGTTTEATDAQG